MPIPYRPTYSITNPCNSKKTTWANNSRTRLLNISSNRPSTLAWVNRAPNIRVRTCILSTRSPRARAEPIIVRKSIWRIWVIKSLAICTPTFRTSNNRKWLFTSSHRIPVRCSRVSFKVLRQPRRISKFCTRIQYSRKFQRGLSVPSYPKTKSSTRVSKTSTMARRKFLRSEASPRLIKPLRSCTQTRTFPVSWQAPPCHQTLTKMVGPDWVYSNRV